MMKPNLKMICQCGQWMWLTHYSRFVQTHFGQKKKVVVRRYRCKCGAEQCVIPGKEDEATRLHII